MLKPNGLLQGDTEPGRTARTRAYNEYGLPVVQGRECGIAAAGLVSVASSWTMPLSRNRLDVETWNS